MTGCRSWPKWLQLNDTGRSVTVDAFQSEVRRSAEVESIVDDYNPDRWRKPWVELISDYTFGMDPLVCNRNALAGGTRITSQVNQQSQDTRVAREPAADRLGPSWPTARASPP